MATRALRIRPVDSCTNNQRDNLPDGGMTATGTGTMNTKIPTLISLCRKVAVVHLERFPPEHLAVCDEMEWEELVRLRHYSTRPREGSGGLDGTGRVAPALSDRALLLIEKQNPHFADNDVADQLVWKDCVEYRFRRGGITRPKSLLVPWPVLVQQIQNDAQFILQIATAGQDKVSVDLGQCCNGSSFNNNDNAHIVKDAVVRLKEAPMSVGLLKATEAGKIIKRALKAYRNLEYRNDGDKKKSSIGSDGNTSVVGYEIIGLLNQMFESWKSLAQDEGVVYSSTATARDMMDCSSREKVGPQSIVKQSLQSSLRAKSHKSEKSQTIQKPATHSNSERDELHSSPGNSTATISSADMEKDLQLLESSCRSWRELFVLLRDREENRRATQGKRMRERRHNLSLDRPKVVKVRPTTAKQERILSGGGAAHRGTSGLVTSSGGSIPLPGKSKMEQLRKETDLVVSRQRIHVASSMATKTLAKHKSATSGLASSMSSFGAAVAFVSHTKNTTKTNKALSSQMKHVALGGGKHMQVPVVKVKKGDFNSRLQGRKR